MPLSFARFLPLLFAALLLAGCGADDGAPEPSAERPEARPEAAAHLVRAQRALEAGAYGPALALVDSAEAAADPAHTRFLADAAFLRARLFTDLGHPDSVRAAYARVLDLVPTYRGAHLNLGNLAFREGQFDEALAAYRREEALHPDPATLVAMGRVHAELGRADSARAAYETALRRTDGRLAEAHARLAVLADTNGDPEAALAHIRRALEHAPADTQYRYYLGALLTRTGQSDEAVPVLQQVVEAEPMHRQAHYNLGLALDRQGDRAAGRRHLALADSLRVLETQVTEWETRARFRPDNPSAWATLAYAYSRLDRLDDAIRAYRIALHLAPGHLDVQYALANLLLTQGEADDALAGYKAVLRQDSTHVDAWINAGVAHVRSGRPAQAAAAWQAALRLAPGHPAATAYLKRVRGAE